MITDEMIEVAARKICATWGYEWDGPDDDEQTAPEVSLPYDDRPSKALYRGAARAALQAAAPLIRAADAARIARLEAALKQAGAWFNVYAEMHEAKGSHDKAETNAHRAKFCMEVAQGTDEDAAKAASMRKSLILENRSLRRQDQERAARIAELEDELKWAKKRADDNTQTIGLRDMRILELEMAPGTVVDLVDALKELEASTKDLKTVADEALDSLDAANARIAELEAALAPFAVFGGTLAGKKFNRSTASFRRAAAVMEKKP